MWSRFFLFLRETLLHGISSLDLSCRGQRASIELMNSPLYSPVESRPPAKENSLSNRSTQFSVRCAKETRYRRRLEDDLYNSNDTVIFMSRYVIHRPYNRRYLIDTVRLVWSLSRPTTNGVINGPKNIVSNDRLVRRPRLKLQITLRQDNWSMQATGCSCAIMIAGYPWPMEKKNKASVIRSSIFFLLVATFSKPLLAFVWRFTRELPLSSFFFVELEQGSFA